MKKAIVDVANYFIDLYNESLVMARLIIQGFVALFKTTLAHAQHVLSRYNKPIQKSRRFIKGLFQTLVKLFEVFLRLTVA